MPPRKPIEVGDYFTIPLGESRDVHPVDLFALGQVLSIEPAAMNSYGCAFWPRLEEGVLHQLSTPPAIVCLTTPDLLKSRRWKIAGNTSVLVPVGSRRYEAFRQSKWGGAKIVGSGIIRTVLRACHGLEYWDQYYEPDYMTKLLQPGVKVPKNARFKPDA